MKKLLVGLVVLGVSLSVGCTLSTAGQGPDFDLEGTYSVVELTRNGLACEPFQLALEEKSFTDAETRLSIQSHRLRCEAMNGDGSTGTSTYDLFSWSYFAKADGSLEAAGAGATPNTRSPAGKASPGHVSIAFARTDGAYKLELSSDTFEETIGDVVYRGRVSSKR